MAASLATASIATSSAAADPVTIVALGDSLTQGYGLPVDQGFVPQLQRWLNDQGADATVLNAGVSGDTTAGGLARTDWALTPETDALIVALGGNDLLRGFPPAESRSNLEAILQKATARNLPVLLVGLIAPGNYGPDYKANFDAIYPELSAKYGTLYAENFLGPIAVQPDRENAMNTLMQPDRLHPNAEGVALIVEGLGPKALELIENIE
ncbi:MAG: arylesterase [Paracoccaceae bacterium]|nr:arylesterase [Paracoccaceae bacterium]